MADALGAVADKLSRCRGAVSIDGLRVAALRGVGSVLGSGEGKHVRPLLELLGV